MVQKKNGLTLQLQGACVTRVFCPNFFTIHKSKFLLFCNLYKSRQVLQVKNSIVLA